MTAAAKSSQCEAQTRAGRRCRRRATLGGRFCQAHTPGASVGRPTVLTPEVQKSICDAIRAGAYAGEAAAHAGVHRATYQRWMSQGAGESAPPELRAFVEAVRLAEADAEVEAVDLVRRATQPTVLHSPYCQSLFEQHSRRACMDTEMRGATADFEGIPHPVDVGCKPLAGDPRMATWMLERRFPDRWRRRDTHEVTGPEGEPLVPDNGVDLAKLSEDELAQLQKLLSDAATSDS